MSTSKDTNKRSLAVEREIEQERKKERKGRRCEADNQALPCGTERSASNDGCSAVVALVVAALSHKLSGPVPSSSFFYFTRGHRKGWSEATRTLRPSGTLPTSW